MPKLDRETIFDEVQGSSYSIAEQGPLFGPITAFEIRRDEDYSLILQSISDKDSRCVFQTPPAGTVSITSGAVKFISGAGEATASGITPRGTNTKIFERRSGVGRQQTSRLDRISWVAKGASPAARTIEWIDNCPTSFIWPATVVGWNEEGENVSFCASRHQIGRSWDADADVLPLSMHSCCVHLNVAGVDLFFGKAPASKKGKSQRGFILYDGSVDEITRTKIRDALSFMIGRYLVYLGSTDFDLHWEPVAAVAVSSVTLNKGAFGLPTSPPSLLDFESSNYIQPDLLEAAISGVVAGYDKYNLGPVFWNYWHALNSPVHMAAVNFGAIVEALQSTYYEVSPAVSKKIITPAAWKGIRSELLKVLDGARLEKVEDELFRNKISNLNLLPQSNLMRKFLMEVGLEMGSVEEKAWRDGRNRAAHGGIIRADQYANVIRENHVFQTLVNRIIIAITQAGELYIDYYSIGRPARALVLCIPSPSEP